MIYLAVQLIDVEKQAELNDNLSSIYPLGIMPPFDRCTIDAHRANTFHSRDHRALRVKRVSLVRIVIFFFFRETRERGNKSTQHETSLETSL